jgi:hypothetical protein
MNVKADDSKKLLSSGGKWSALIQKIIIAFVEQ